MCVYVCQYDWRVPWVGRNEGMLHAEGSHDYGQGRNSRAKAM